MGVGDYLSEQAEKVPVRPSFVPPVPIRGCLFEDPTNGPSIHLLYAHRRFRLNLILTLVYQDLEVTERCECKGKVTQNLEAEKLELIGIFKERGMSEPDASSIVTNLAKYVPAQPSPAQPRSPATALPACYSFQAMHTRYAHPPS